MRRSRRPVRPGTVRLIGGEWRRRRLAIPKGAAVRPTPDRVRETLFNWLAGRLPGAVCLDLFAGTGALGFEALSRGAQVVELVERDARLAAALRAHAAELGAGANTIVSHQSAAARLAREAEPRFDLVFLDPPYAEPVEPIAAALAPWLKADALVYVERSADDGLPELPGYTWQRASRAGDVVFGLAARRTAADSPP